MSSSIIEEFMYYLLKDLPKVAAFGEGSKIVLGQTQAYTDMAFLPENFSHFVEQPGVNISKKNQDFAIAKKVNCTFETNGNKQMFELIVPCVAIEIKTFIPITMLGQSDHEARRLKEGNPNSLYIIVAEQNALSQAVNLKRLSIDEIFILRKQKRNSSKNRVADKKPIDSLVVEELYRLVKDFLAAKWYDPQNADAGRLIKA
ncbi:MAG: Bpu10I family restriction endonuclease [Limisphaerales bacterium]